MKPPFETRVLAIGATPDIVTFEPQVWRKVICDATLAVISAAFYRFLVMLPRVINLRGCGPNPLIDFIS